MVYSEGWKRQSYARDLWFGISSLEVTVKTVEWLSNDASQNGRQRFWLKTLLRCSCSVVQHNRSIRLNGRSGSWYFRRQSECPSHTEKDVSADLKHDVHWLGPRPERIHSLVLRRRWIYKCAYTTTHGTPYTWFRERVAIYHRLLTTYINIRWGRDFPVTRAVIH